MHNPRKQRVQLPMLRQYDHQFDQCYVRYVEMSVEGVIGNHPYNVQFWRDVQLYGLQEAWLYLKNSGVAKDTHKLDALKTEIDQVCANVCNPNGVKVCALCGVELHLSGDKFLCECDDPIRTTRAKYNSHNF